MKDPRLVCTVDCGAKCCRMPADVHLSREEAERLKTLAERKGLAFEANVSLASPDHFYMSFGPDQPRCTFLEGTLCGIYEDRPEACKSFPLKKTKGCLLSGLGDPPKVVLAAPRYRGENEYWRTSFEQMKEGMMAAGIYGGHQFVSGVRVDDNRNMLCQKFLRDFDADYLLMVDDDMTFHPGTAEKLLSHQKDIVCGVYFQRGDRCYPHIYQFDGIRADSYGEPAYYWVPPGPSFAELYSAVLPKQKELDRPLILMDPMPVVQVDAAGTGCIMIRRRVLERTPYPWFRQEWGARGDLLFFLRAKEAGFDTYVDTGVICGHLKQEQVTLSNYLEAVEAGRAEG